MNSIVCPDAIIYNTGNAFGLGAIGGFIWYGIKGMRDAPAGESFRMFVSQARIHSPRVAGGFAAFSMLFHATECSMRPITYDLDINKKYGRAFSGFLTSALMSARFGPHAALQNGIFCAGIMLVL